MSNSNILPILSANELKAATRLYDDITVTIHGYEFRLETDPNKIETEYGFCHGWKGYELSRTQTKSNFCEWFKSKTLKGYAWVSDFCNDRPIKAKKTAQEILLHLWFTRERS